jgi:hypothetical protein
LARSRIGGIPSSLCENRSIGYGSYNSREGLVTNNSDERKKVKIKPKIIQNYPIIKGMKSIIIQKGGRNIITGGSQQIKYQNAQSVKKLRPYIMATIDMMKQTTRKKYDRLNSLSSFKEKSPGDKMSRTQKSIKNHTMKIQKSSPTIKIDIQNERRNSKIHNLMLHEFKPF